MFRKRVLEHEENKPQISVAEVQSLCVLIVHRLSIKISWEESTGKKYQPAYLRPNYLSRASTLDMPAHYEKQVRALSLASDFPIAFSAELIAAWALKNSLYEANSQRIEYTTFFSLTSSE